jgi:hypothetical protein
VCKFFPFFIVPGLCIAAWSRGKKLSLFLHVCTKIFVFSFTTQKKRGLYTLKRRGIIHIPEYQSVCSLVRIGSPAPLPQASVSPSWNQREGGQHSLAGKGVGGASSDDWRESLALCIGTLCAQI